MCSYICFTVLWCGLQIRLKTYTFFVWLIFGIKIQNYIKKYQVIKLKKFWSSSFAFIPKLAASGQQFLSSKNIFIHWACPAKYIIHLIKKNMLLQKFDERNIYLFTWNDHLVCKVFWFWNVVCNTLKIWF